MTPHEKTLPLSFKTCKKGLHDYPAEDRCCLECRHKYEQNYWLLNKKEKSEYRKEYRKRNMEGNTEQYQRGLETYRRKWKFLWKKNKERAIWRSMIFRCTNPKSKNYKNYGGRGITVCDRWQGIKGFENFMEDMGMRPTHHHSIDREDNEKGYGPDNCRWLKCKEQNRNRRNNRMVTWNGKTKCVAEWSEVLGIQAATLYARLRKWKDVDRAFTQEVR